MTAVEDEGDAIPLLPGYLSENGIDFSVADVRDFGIAGY